MVIPSNLSLFSLLPLVFFIIFLLKWFCASSTTRKKLPPSPPKLPIIGHLHKLGLLPHRSLQSLSQKYGPFMLLHLGSKPVLVVSSADAACQIMKTHDLVFANRPKLGVMETILQGRMDIAFSAYGENWRQVRSICVLQLLSNKMVQSFRHIREEETSQMIEKIRRSCSSSSSSLVNLSDMFVTLTNDVVFRATLGRKYSEGKIVEMLLGFAELLGVFNIADYIPWLAWVNRFNGLDARVEKVAKEFHKFMDGVIQEHRERREGDCRHIDDTSEARGSNFLDILFEIQGVDFSGSPPEDDDIKAIIFDIFAGGTDTTYTLMDWAMVELLRHPKTMEKLQNEVRQVVQGKSEVTEDDLQKMPYLKAVIKETLRLHCPIPLLVPHESTQDIKVMGYHISAGTQVIVNGWAIGRDPRSWEKPEEFQPERFLKSEIDFHGFHFELIPFGAGRRGCPGTNFAIAVNELALAKLLHKFSFALPEGAKPKDMNMDEKPGINVKRKQPLILVASPCSS